MLTEEDGCPLCRKVHKIKMRDAYGIDEPSIEYDCRHCGKYKITLYYAAKLIKRKGLSDVFKKDPHILPAIIRERNILGIKLPVLFLSEFDNDETVKKLILNTDVPKTPLEKAERMLYLLSKLPHETGDYIHLDFKYDVPLCYGKKIEELRFLLDSLIELDYLKKKGLNMSIAEEYLITMKGWGRIYNMEQGIGTNQVFVAMSFDDDLDDIYFNGIKPALEECKYKTIIRLKEHEHIGIIDARMIAEIRKSCLLIVDVTKRNRGAYFEGGMALGHQIPVIWTCDEKEQKDVHFDTSHFNHIFWKDANDLKDKLIKRIKGAIVPLKEFPSS